MPEHPGKKPASPPREMGHGDGTVLPSGADGRPGVYLGAGRGAVIGPPDKAGRSAEGEFLAAVARSRDGVLIRYSKRLELLELADRLKIGRFRANLLMAEVQQRAGGVVPRLLGLRQRAVPAAARPAEGSEEWRDRFFLGAALFIVCALVNLVLARFLFGGP